MGKGHDFDDGFLFGYLMGSSSDKEGCYIATCVYGSYDCPEVWMLRRFRDQRLRKSAAGRAFVRFYYAVSPALVRRFGRVGWLRRLAGRPLGMLVARLRAEGVSGAPYSDPNRSAPESEVAVKTNTAVTSWAIPAPPGRGRM